MSDFVWGYSTLTKYLREAVWPTLSIIFWRHGGCVVSLSMFLSHRGRFFSVT